MRAWVACACLFGAGLAPALSAQASSVDGIVLPGESIHQDVGAIGLESNPALLGFLRGSEAPLLYAEPGDRVSSDEIDFALYAVYCGTSQGTVKQASVARVFWWIGSKKHVAAIQDYVCSSGGFLWEVLQNLSNSLSGQSRRRAQRILVRKQHRLAIHQSGACRHTPTIWHG